MLNPTRVMLLTALLALALLCWQMVGCDEVGAAPAPLLKGKDEMPDSLVGEWIVEWASAEYRTSLGADGSYRCYNDTYKGLTYVGVWTLRGRTLWVSESILDCTVQHWQVRLDRDMRGTTSNQVNIRLRRPR